MNGLHRANTWQFGTRQLFVIVTLAGTYLAVAVVDWRFAFGLFGPSTLAACMLWIGLRVENDQLAEGLVRGGLLTLGFWIVLFPLSLA